jgi:osmotically-inducible protein OsmY
VSPELLSDDAVANHVRLALEADADITKPTITVSVEGGVATLGGTVGRPWERVLAEDVVMGVRGVREVRNHILVDPIEQVEDEALSRTISATLAVTRGLGNSVIHVATNGGHVVLSGEVAELWQKEVVLTVVRRFQPQRITDKIIVVGPS